MGMSSSTLSFTHSQGEGIHRVLAQTSSDLGGAAQDSGHHIVREASVKFVLAAYNRGGGNPTDYYVYLLTMLNFPQKILGNSCGQDSLTSAFCVWETASEKTHSSLYDFSIQFRDTAFVYL